MSRYYQMDVTIRDFKLENEFWIKDALADNWNWDYFDKFHNIKIVGSGKSSLCGGETEEEFARRLTHAIWKANGEFCYVEILATCLENLPYERYNLDEDAYEEFTETKQ